MLNQIAKDEINEVLNQMDDILARNDEGSKTLWDVLTGLRGPDDNLLMGDLKPRTTSHIREQAFPRFFGVMENLIKGRRLISTERLPEKVIDYSWGVPSHFMIHVDWARAALVNLGRRPRD